MAGGFLFGHNEEMQPQAAKTRELVDLTALRALFALWVFAYHINLYAQFARGLPCLGGLVAHGYLGVDGFFILARVDRQAANPNELLRFWGKRLARLYPVHLAVILLLAAMYQGGLALGIAPRDAARFSLGELAAHLALVQGWGFSHDWAWNYQSWSISTEWAGYLAFPAVIAGFAAVSAEIAAFFLPLCFFCLALVSAAFHGLNLTFADSLLRFFPEFIAGIAAAKLVPACADEFPDLAIALAGLAILLAFSLTGSDAMMVLGLWLVIWGLAMRGDAERPATIGRIAALHWLGVISYSVYMSFSPVELLVTQGFRHLAWNPEAHRLLFCGLMAACTLGLATLLHYSVERPARRAINRRLGRRRQGKEADTLAAGSVPL